MTFPLSTFAAAALAAAPALPQDLGVKAPPHAGATAIVGATIHPVSGPTIERGWIVFEGDRIVSVGQGELESHPDARRIDGAGKHVYPGLVGAYTQTGLVEIGAVRATRDADEVGDATPEVRAVVAVNPDSTILPVTRANGILTVGVFPTGGDVPGQAGVIRMDGWTWEDLAIREVAGLVVSWPSVRPSASPADEKERKEQAERIRERLDRIAEVFDATEAYLDARASNGDTPVDLRWEAVARVLPEEGDEQLPVFLLANDYDQIVSAVSFAARHGLRAVVVGGRDADLCAELLRRHDVAVIVDGTTDLPKRGDSPYDERYRLPLRLEEAGLRWCLASGEGTAHERSLPYSAALAVAHGLDREVALRSITLSAAEILGVGERLGSLEPGKLATLLLTTGDPMRMETRIERAFVDGREIDLRNKQTRLWSKYREKYRQLGWIE